MTRPAPLPDLFGPLADVGDDIMAGLDLMMRSPPLWPVDRGTSWVDQVARARAFAERWNGLCRNCGWSPLDLYGAHHRAPAARLSCLGAAFLVARSSHHVLNVAPGDILVATKSAARLRIYRAHPDPDAVVA